MEPSFSEVQKHSIYVDTDAPRSQNSSYSVLFYAFSLIGTQRLETFMALYRGMVALTCGETAVEFLSFSTSLTMIDNVIFSS